MFKTTCFLLFVCTLTVCQATNDFHMHSLNNSYFVKHNDIYHHDQHQSELTIDIVHVILMLSIAGIWNYMTKDMMVPFYILSDICALYNTGLSNILYICSMLLFTFYIGLMATVLGYYITKPAEAYYMGISILAKYGTALAKKAEEEEEKEKSE